MFHFLCVFCVRSSSRHKCPYCLPYKPVSIVSLALTCPYCISNRCALHVVYCFIAIHKYKHRIGNLLFVDFPCVTVSFAFAISFVACPDIIFYTCSDFFSWTGIIDSISRTSSTISWEAYITHTRWMLRAYCNLLIYCRIASRLPALFIKPCLFTFHAAFPFVILLLLSSSRVPQKHFDFRLRLRALLV